MQPALAAALSRHATRPRDAELVTDLTGGQPRAYADGLRPALGDHALAEDLTGLHAAIG